MDRKWTHVMFAGFGMLLAWILSKSIDWIWGYFAKPQSMTVGTIAVVVAGVVTLIAWKNERLFTLLSEVAGELKKVTWPTREQVRNLTVLVFAISAAVGIFIAAVDFGFTEVVRFLNDVTG